MGTSYLGLPRTNCSPSICQLLGTGMVSQAQSSKATAVKFSGRVFGEGDQKKRHCPSSRNIKGERSQSKMASPQAARALSTSANGTSVACGASLLRPATNGLHQSGIEVAP